MPLVIDGNNIECVSEFPYLGSLIAASGRLDVEVEKRIASALEAIGALQHAVFDNSQLSTVTKRHVYGACVLSVLLYGSECWVSLKKNLNKLDCFHHRCLKTVLKFPAQSNERNALHL